jgi:hypothetical protein
MTSKNPQQSQKKKQNTNAKAPQQTKKSTKQTQQKAQAIHQSHHPRT